MYKYNENVDMLSSIFKYRCFCRNTNEGIEEDVYWEESMKDTVFCSLAKDFNRSNIEDCKLEYNRNAIKNTIYKLFEHIGKRKHRGNIFIDYEMRRYICGMMITLGAIMQDIVSNTCFKGYYVSRNNYIFPSFI